MTAVETSFSPGSFNDFRMANPDIPEEEATRAYTDMLCEHSKSLPGVEVLCIKETIDLATEAEKLKRTRIEG